MANSRKMDTTSAEEIFYLNKRFDSYEELSLARSTFEKSRYTQLWVKDSMTIEGNKNRCTKKKYNENIKYAYISYACKHGGKNNWKSKSTGMRPNSR